jgi:hypothetical protein
MPAPRLDDANIEYTFADTEILTAKILDPLKILWYQTLYAQIWKQKASMLVPETVELDRSYLMKICELDGQLNFIQRLLDDHKNAIKEFNERKLQDTTASNSQTNSGGDMQRIAHEAGTRVHSG